MAPEAPPWPEIFDNDDERKHPFEAGQAEYERLLESYVVFGYRLIHLPKTGVCERADFVESHL